MPDYARGTTISLVANYLDGESRPILTGLGPAWVDLYYYNTLGSRVSVISSGSMTLDATDANRFFYIWGIPGSAEITNYIAEYNNTFSGTHIQSTEVFGVTVPVNITGVFIGNVTVSGTVVDVSGTGIQNAQVNFSYLTGSTVLTSAVTDISGNYVTYLNPDDYFVTADAMGFMPNNINKTVPTAVTTLNFGQITLLSEIIGSLVISDTYQTKDPNTQNIEALDNFKVSLYAKQSSASLSSPLGTTQTNSSGTFILNADPGEYVLRVEGTQADGDVFNTSYDIVVNSAYASGDPKNFRYRGTSQYNYLL